MSEATLIIVLAFVVAFVAFLVWKSKPHVYRETIADDMRDIKHD